MSTTTITGTDAIAFAARTGAQLYKHADPVDGAREITVDEARAIAREDVSLVWCEQSAAEAFDLATEAAEITYDLAPSAAEGICDDTARAREAFAAALRAQYPNADVTVRLANVDASSYWISGERDGLAWGVSKRHFGGASWTADPDLDVNVSSVETDANERDRRAYEAAIEAANA
jgi:hypothetical protein